MAAKTFAMGLPNILLVVLDTARADAFEPYGAKTGASPAIAQFASSGSAHQAAFSTACWTVPAHGSLFSGRLPRSSGLNHIGGQQTSGYRAALVERQQSLLPSVLRNAGYATYGVSTNSWISEMSGFDTGFDDFRYLAGGRYAGVTAGTLLGKARWIVDALRARTDDGANAVAQLVDQWADTSRGSPFFMFVNLIECHSPYLPPRPWNDLSSVDRARTAVEALRHLNFSELWKAGVGGLDVPDGALERMRRGYAGAIRQLDDWVARVLEILDRHGLLANTQVIITSDHGENFGEGGLLGHSFSLDQRLIRIPFLTRGPLQLDADQVMSISDLPRLLTAALGLEDHPWEGDASSGVAVAQFDAPGSLDDPGSIELVSSWGLGQEALERLSTSFTCATDGVLKVLRRAGRDRVVDLRADPLEESPRELVTSDHDRYGERLRHLQRALDRAQSAEQPKPSPQSPADADETRLAEQMRLLGYL